MNPKPFTVPEVSRWKGGEGVIILPGSPILSYEGDKTQDIAIQLSEDYNAMHFGEMKLKKGNGGDLILRMMKDKDLGEEGYKISICRNRVVISAPTVDGLRWATRTFLQLRELSDSIPVGEIIDVPAFSFRGLVLDCGRKYIPMDYLHRLVDVMSYRKMNKLHIHLNDNGFRYYFDDDWDKTQAAFRLESERFPALTSRDGFYTKKEFRNLQTYAASRGVEIVPEIDFPAHSLAFTRFRPQIGSTDDKYGCDHLDIMKDETYCFLDSLLDEYLGGEDPVFIGKRFHIGTDEYSNRDSVVVEKFRYLTDRYIRLAENYGKIPVVWGALTHAKGVTPVKSDGVEMYLWYNGYADPDEMLKAGYNVVSIPDGWVYIVPEAGYYYNYLNTESLYKKWSPQVVGDKRIDADNARLMGGMFAVWNDHPGNGITVKDIHHRIMEALPTMATKTWTRESDISCPYETFISRSRLQAEAPGINYLGRPNCGEGIVFRLDTVRPRQHTGLQEIGYSYDVEFDINGAEEDKGTVLFKSPSATVWISDPVTGSLAFSREDKLYHFRHFIRQGEKNHIRITGDNRATSLYVDGVLVDNLNIRRKSYNGGKNQMAEVRTLVFPLAETGAFKSDISNLKVSWKDCPQPR